MPLDPRLREHTVWCLGHHNHSHGCIRELAVGTPRGAAVIRLIGIPADNQYIELDGLLHSVADLDGAIAVLTALRPDLVEQDRIEALLEQENR